MTKDEVIAAIDALDAAKDDDFFDTCTGIANALVELGVVIDDDVNFEPNWQLLPEYPPSVHKFVAGMVSTNDSNGTAQ